jgi:phage N-6-adenine-methyltransferase
MNPVHFSSATDLWSTPDDFFKKLDDEFHFTLDVCATPENAKCRMYFTAETDGLSKPWGRFVAVDEAAWMNPPYGKEIGKWVKKAYEEAKCGLTVVCLLPARTDTDWFHRYIVPFSGINSDPAQHGWAAGIIDGEGCIHIRRNAATETTRHKSDIYDLILKVTMTDEETVRRLQIVFGVGTVTVDENRGEGNRPAYSWTCRSAAASEVLQRVYPFLVTKRVEAMYALEFSLLERARRGQKRVPAELMVERERYYSLLRDLKRDRSGHFAPVVELRWVRGRLRFGGAKNSAPFPSVVAIYRGRK